MSSSNGLLVFPGLANRNLLQALGRLTGRYITRPHLEQVSMATDINNIAIFCDFENLARGAQEAQYAQLRIQKILERLLVNPVR